MKELSYPGINMIKTGKWIRGICKYKNIAVKELCDLLGLGSPQSIYGWFGGRTLPSLDNFYALSQIYGMSLGELIINQEEDIPGDFMKRVGPQRARLMRYRMRFSF